MAINYVVSYTFSPSTTISSSQVNTNFSDNANTWTGLEAKTKSFSFLKVDATPTTANEVAIKSYVDSLMSYRRPVLQYISSTTVNIETGNDGVAGDATVLFPDGNFRTDSTTSHRLLDVSRVASLSGTKQSGLQSGTVAANTWYAVYAVKASDNSTDFVAVAYTVFPLQTNFSTLNSNFGSNSWVYLGMIRYGDNSSSTTGILTFFQVGNLTTFTNECVANTTLNQTGIRLATSASASVITYTYAAGGGAAQIPNHVTVVYYGGSINGAAATTGAYFTQQLSATNYYERVSGPASVQLVANSGPVAASVGAIVAVVGPVSTLDIFLRAFVDNVLGVGANALL